MRVKDSMNLPTKIALAAAACFLLLGLEREAAAAPAAARPPAGATLVSFGDLGGGSLPEDPAQARPGDYLKALPRAVRGLENQRVMIRGFMIPTQAQGREVRAFMLVRSQATCCFGWPLQVADVVETRMIGQPAAPLMDRVVNVVGRLHVQEHWVGPYLGSLFRLDAESATSSAPALPLDPARSPQARGLE